MLSIAVFVVFVFTLWQAAPTFDFPLVTKLTLFIALPVKFTVDTVRGMVPQIPSQALPLVGVVAGFLYALLALVADKAAFESAVYAQCAFAAVGAQLGAMAVTSNQTRVQKVDEKINAALDSTKGTSREDFETAFAKKEALPRASP